MKKILIAFVLTSLSVLAQAAPIIGEQIYNEFRCTGTQSGTFCSKLVENEPLSWRSNFEQAVALGFPVLGINYSNDVPVKLSNDQLAKGYYELDPSEVDNIVALLTTGGMDISVDMITPWSSIDCQNIAKALSTKRRDLTIVRCKGDESQQVLGQTISVKAPRYTYDLTHAVNAVYGTETYTVRKCFGTSDGSLFSFCWDEKRERTVLVSGAYSYDYDEKVFEEWDISYTSIGGISNSTGKWRKQWSSFEMVPGFVPVNVGGITTFISADIKKSSSWFNNAKGEGPIDLSADMPGMYDESVIIHPTGRKLGLRCSGQELLGDRGYLPNNDMDVSVPSGLVDDARGLCKDGARLDLANFRAFEDDSGLAATITFSLNASGNKAYKGINSYAADLKNHIIRKTSIFEHYDGLLDGYLDGNVDGFGIRARDYSNSLKDLMQVYLSSGADGSIEITQSSIDALFYTYSEALAVQEESDSFPKLVTGFYKLAFPIGSGTSVSAPDWYEDFLLWVRSEDVDTTYPIDVYMSFIQQSASMYYGLSDASFFPYECEYKDAWLSVGDALAVGDKFMEFMNYYNPGGDNPSPAYEDQDLSEYDSAKSAVSGVMFKFINGEAVPYSQLLNGAVNPFGYLGMCPSGSIS